MKQRTISEMIELVRSSNGGALGSFLVARIILKTGVNPDKLEAESQAKRDQVEAAIREVCGDIFK